MGKSILGTFPPPRPPISFITRYTMAKIVKLTTTATAHTEARMMSTVPATCSLPIDMLTTQCRGVTQKKKENAAINTRQRRAMDYRHTHLCCQLTHISFWTHSPPLHPDDQVGLGEGADFA